MKDINFHFYNAAKQRYEKIPARKVTIPGFEDLECAIHRSVLWRSDKWTVSECTTGTAIGVGKTQNEAIADAASRLEARRHEIALAIVLNIAIYGISPMFREEAALEESK